MKNLCFILHICHPVHFTSDLLKRKNNVSLIIVESDVKSGLERQLVDLLSNILLIKI